MTSPTWFNLAIILLFLYVYVDIYYFDIYVICIMVVYHIDDVWFTQYFRDLHGSMSLAWLIGINHDLLPTYLIKKNGSRKFSLNNENNYGSLYSLLALRWSFENQSW
jgi:uncharacterized membrane protein